MSTYLIPLADNVIDQEVMPLLPIELPRFGAIVAPQELERSRKLQQKGAPGIRVDYDPDQEEDDLRNILDRTLAILRLFKVGLISLKEISRFNASEKWLKVRWYTAWERSKTEQQPTIRKETIPDFQAHKDWS